MLEIQKFIDELSDKTPESIKSNLYKVGILSSYSSDGRMVFYSSKKQRFNKSNLLKLECNGLVMNINTNKPLVIPPLLYKSNVNVDIVNKHLSNDLYDILYIEDGTVINFYYWLDSWRISTARSYDITNEKWGSITYKKVVSDILSENLDQFYQLMDKNKCYTFGIKHDSLHPFREGNKTLFNKIWFIQSVLLNTDTDDTDDTGKNVGYKISYKNNMNNMNIKNSVLLNNNPTNIKNLFPELKNSLNEFFMQKIVNYGFILRSKNSNITGEYSNILLESSLLQTIRKLYYNSHFNSVSKEFGYNRVKYIITNAYLNVNNQNLFTMLFPQYIIEFNKLYDITTDLVTSIMCIMTNNTSNKKVCLKYKTNIKLQLLTSSANVIYNSINSRYVLNIDDMNLTQKITSILVNNQWNTIYYNLYINE
jgi:hypothetical protein